MLFVAMFKRVVVSLRRRKEKEDEEKEEEEEEEGRPLCSWSFRVSTILQDGGGL